MWTVAGLVEAPARQVADVLFAIRPGRVSEDNALLLWVTYQPLWNNVALALDGGPEEYTLRLGDDPRGYTRMTLDRPRGMITLQGNWWYRGQHTIESHERGAAVVYRVYNMASGLGRFTVPLMQRGFGKGMAKGRQRLLDALGERLHCNTAPLP
ncbi:hypothetical protein ABT297_38850 [Dactylosporangium sp. NPDC000555]|uniref:hypothetical protein n=1 Tax=Dactylosporangium sp. NPDC000555 TaxID=3154260 RepID=UPI003318871E